MLENNPCVPPHLPSHADRVKRTTIAHSLSIAEHGKGIQQDLGAALTPMELSHLHLDTIACTALYHPHEPS